MVLYEVHTCCEGKGGGCRSCDYKGFFLTPEGEILYSLLEDRLESSRIEDLENQIRALEDQIQALQGEVNVIHPAFNSCC